MTTFVSPTSFTFSAGSAGALYTQGYYQCLKSIRDALVAGGMVQTTDTNQQDFTILDTNASSPAALAAGAFSGFFIMRFNDALQATKPFFIKIRFAVAAGNTQFQGLYIQMGSGTDGAGNITGPTGSITTSCYLNSSSSSSGAFNTANRRLTYGCGNGSECWVSIHEAANVFNESILLMIERTRDDSGAYDGEGVLVNVVNASPASSISGPVVYHCAFPTNGRTDNLWYGFNKGLIVPRVLPDRNTMVNGNDIGPMWPFGGGFFPKFRQSHQAFCFPNQDMSNYHNIFQMPVKGVPRTFRQFGWHYTYYTQWIHHGQDRSSIDTELQRPALALMWE